MVNVLGKMTSKELSKRTRMKWKWCDETPGYWHDDKPSEFQFVLSPNLKILNIWRGDKEYLTPRQILSVADKVKRIQEVCPDITSKARKRIW